MAKRGRPTKYSEEIIKKTTDYIENYRNFGEVIPSIEGLALVLKVNRDTIYEWKNKFKEFSDMVEALQLKQTKILLNLGLLNKINPSIAKLLLAKQGYTEKQEMEIKEKQILIDLSLPDDSLKEKNK